MRMRRTPNPNRNHPLHCPYCAAEVLFPAEDSEFSWHCMDCSRVFEVKFFGTNDAQHSPAPALSASQALHHSLSTRGHLL